MTALEIAREIAEKYGVTGLSDNNLNYILWEYTGFPDFWAYRQDGNTPEECLRTQLHRHFSQNLVYRVMST